MGHVTVSLEKKDEEKLRSMAASKYKNKKGSMARVISESLALLEKKSKMERARVRQFKWMDKGFKMGKIMVKSREELYDRQ